MSKKRTAGELIQAYMQAEDLRQMDFAARCDIHASLLNMILAGTREVTPIVALKIQKGTGGKILAVDLCAELAGLLPRSTANRTGTTG